MGPEENGQLSLNGGESWGQERLQHHGQHRAAQSDASSLKLAYSICAFAAPFGVALNEYLFAALVLHYVHYVPTQR